MQQNVRAAALSILVISCADAGERLAADAETQETPVDPKKRPDFSLGDGGEECTAKGAKEGATDFAPFAVKRFPFPTRCPNAHSVYCHRPAG